MKYKIINSNLSGGKIPEILGVDLNPVNKTDYMNKKAPFYFNLDKNPVVSSNNNLYSYDFVYKPESQVLQIDNNLDLRLTGRFDALVPPVPSPTYVPSREDIHRIILVNGLEIPYFYGLIHNNKELFGKIKLLFQYIDWEIQPDGSKRKITVIKNESDIINFIDSMFIISDELNVLVSLSKSLNNIIDKYIFINKFYEFLEMVTWTPSIDYSIADVTDPAFNFTNIPTVPADKKKRDYKQMQKIINEGNFSQLAPDGQIIFDKFVLGSDSKFLSDEKKLDYIKFITWMDFLLGKLGNLFDTTATRTDTGKINLINLIDLYSGYIPIFKDSINPKFDDRLQVCKFVNTIDKINVRDLKRIIFGEAIGLYNLAKLLDKIKNWPINQFANNTNNINIHWILILSYFDMRINQNQISQGRYINALPINKTEALTNLFDNNRSDINKELTNRELYKTTLYFAGLGTGPEIYRGTPIVNYFDLGLNFPVCVENTILQFVKCLFWDYTRQSFAPNPLGLSENNFLVKFMEEYNKTSTQTDQIVEIFVRPLINLTGIDYVKVKGSTKYEYNATDSNFVKTLLYLLKNITPSELLTNRAVSTNSLDDDITELNTILSPYNFEVEISDEPTSRRHDSKKVELRKNGNNVLIVMLYKNQHGDPFKPQDDIDIYDIERKIHRFINYFEKNNDISCESCEYWFNPNKIIRTGLLENQYFNSSNIYWLNFINPININCIIEYIVNNTIFSQTLKNNLIIQYFEILNKVLKIQGDNKKEFYKNNFNFVYQYFKNLLIYIDINEYPIIYEESKQFINNNIDFIVYKPLGERTVLGYLIYNNPYNLKINSLIYFIELIISNNEDILANYDRYLDVPLNIFLQLYVQRPGFITKNEDVLHIISLLSKNKKVLIEFYGKPEDITIDNINTIPLYFVLGSELGEMINRRKKTLFNDIIELLIDSEKTILVKYKDIISPIEYFLDKNDILIASYLDYSSSVINNVSLPIKTLQTNITIFNSSGNSLFYKTMINVLEYNKPKFVYAIDFFINEGLLLDSTVHFENQPVLNTIQNYESLLFLYLNNITDKDINLTTLHCLYNPELFIKGTSPIWGYLTNPNLNCNTYNSQILCPNCKNVPYEGKVYSVVKTRLPNSLIPAGFLVEQMMKLSDVDLYSFISSQESVRLFTCLCKTSSKTAFEKYVPILDIFFGEKIPDYNDKSNFTILTLNAVQIIDLFKSN